MGHQRLLLRQFQFELVTQEHSETLLDLLGFGFRSGEPQQGVVGVPAIAQPAIARIVRILAGQAVQPPVKRPHLRAVAAPAGPRDRLFHRAVGRVTRPKSPSGVFRDQHCFDEAVQLVQVDSGQDRGRDTTLRRAGERFVPDPILQVSGGEHVAHQPQEPSIVDGLRQRRDHDLMIKTPEAVGDVTLDEPGRPGPGVDHLPQRGMAAPAGTKTVGPVGELDVVVRLQQQAHHLADQFVRPGRQAQRAQLPVLLRDQHPPHWTKPVTLEAHRLDDAADLA